MRSWKASGENKAPGRGCGAAKKDEENGMKTWMRILLGLCLAAVLLSAAGAEEAYKTLRQGDKGQAVLALKERMYELGYFTSTKFSNEFNATTKERLIELQKKNGLKADGIATPQVQALIFSDDCLPRSAADPTPAPAAKPAAGQAQAPEAAEGLAFLPEGEKPIASADRNKGTWSYISPSLHVEIRQYSGKSPWGANIWLEASIRMKNPEQLVSLLSDGKKPGTRMLRPDQIIEQQGTPEPILTISDDYFGYRVKYIKDEKHVGVIIRNGQILYDDPKTGAGKGKKFPPLDVLAIFQDGSMKTFLSGEHTAQEYVNMGARHTLSFGPILVQNGQVFTYPDHTVYGDYGAPRLGIGITPDGTVKVLNALGRRTDAKGVSMQWMAEKMVEMGCVEALNLDGGNSISLIFMGDMINRPAKTAKKDIRPVTGLIGIMDGN